MVRGRRLLLYEDNQAVVAILTNLTTRSPLLMAELRALIELLDGHAWARDLFDAMLAEAGADVQLEDVSIASSSAIRGSSRRRLAATSGFVADECGGALRLVDGARANLSRSDLRSRCPTSTLQ